MRPSHLHSRCTRRQGDRNPDQEAAFREALGAMAHMYASAVGTTVLQLKEIPPRPREFDGALCLFGLTQGKGEADVRAALACHGLIVSFERVKWFAVVRFASHREALAAKRAGSPLGLCEGVDTLYNEHSYDGRRNESGRDDDDGRGWCAARRPTTITHARFHTPRPVRVTTSTGAPSKAP